ncbi:hypothetical protein SUGI_0096230 [Cryptomeria japonica]|uniref:uncharacterized protein LOC131064427 n=1 Tax=Cryptomeria japonica TaxID=3369 RepID=UPI002408BAA1|nr:uncharacterized protein LOC131064427 [Cryptomeria japonica]GLJ08795.1 hypothetical protein SUGI_0096230 [Cryptomeria japonica]
MATLNFVGLFLKTQRHIHWLIPACLTFTAVVMGFSTTLRLSIVGYMGKILSRALQWVFELLPLTMRRRVYYWGNWVDLLKPINDLQSKIVRGNISVLVAGGAKFYSPSLAGPIISAERLVDEICRRDGPFLFKCDSKSDSSGDSVYIEWIFDNAEKCSLKAGRVASKDVRLSLKEDHTYIVCCDGDCSTKEVIKFFRSDCCEENKSLMKDDKHTASVDIDCGTEEEAIKLFIFAAYMAELKSGSLKSCERNSSTVYVRRFVESINAYVRSGYPPLYKLELQGVVVR